MGYSFGYWGKTSPSTGDTTATKVASAVPATIKPQEHTTKAFTSIFGNDSNDVFWPELRRTFTLDHYTYSAPVQRQIAWFRNHPKWLNRILTRAAPYMFYVYSQVKKRNLPGELVLLPVIESAYDPFAYSDRGAAGLWQLMPGTATGYGLKQDWWYDGRRDIYASTNAALDYLTYLQNFFNGNWLYAIASYDAGQGTIQHAINYNAERDRSTSFWNLPLSSETNAYVPQLLALAAVIADPHEFGITIPDLKNGPYFAEVNVGKQINLATAAKAAGISLAELYKLNPGYNRWATDPNGPSLLLLPVDKIDAFKENLVNLPAIRQPAVGQLVTWDHYKVRHGDSLGSIADQFGTHIALLQEMNKLNSKILHSGQVLLVPKQTHTVAGNSHSQHVLTAKTPKGAQSVVVDVNIGDSLWSLAVKYQVQPTQILQWNHLAANAPLHVGQKLFIFVPEHTHTAAHTKSQSATQLSSASKHTYKVTSGDTLDAIARKFGTTAEAIAKLNHLGNSMLHLGEELKIPAPHSATPARTTIQPSEKKKHSTAEKNIKPTHATSSLIRYTVKSGDTLSSIAKAHHVSIENLQKWNKRDLSKFLHKGQVLIIYT